MVTLSVAPIAIGFLVGAVILWPQSKPAEARTWSARIINTWSGSQHKYLGTYGYKNPQTSAHSGTGYGEGDTVAVVCQNRHGRKIMDHTSGESSNVWDYLSDGSWVSDYYTTLTKTIGDTPPEGMPVCPK
jgi:hypothetical protein